MLILAATCPPAGSFWARRRARRGHIPPRVMPCRVGPFEAVRVEWPGRAPAGGVLPVQEDRVIVTARNWPGGEAGNRRLVTEYARRLGVNACLADLKRLARRRRTAAVLVDPAGECAGVAAELAAVCADVTVITDRPDRYAACQTYIRRQWGALLTLAEPGPLPVCDLVLAPYGLGGLPVPAGVPAAAPDRSGWPGPPELFVPRWAARPALAAWDPVCVTAGVFAAYHPPALMQAAGRAPHFAKNSPAARDGA